MKLQFGWMSLLLLIMCAFVSCADNVDDEEEYVDWKKKNEYAFIKQLEEAKDSIALAREKYGDDWEAHCPWRVYRTYAQDERVNGKAIDSIYMKKVSGEAKSAPAFYTDSIGVNYMLRLQPSTSYPDGKLADFSAPTDSSVEETFENREQIEISRYYERLPKPAIIATEEFLDGELYYRDASK